MITQYKNDNVLDNNKAVQGSRFSSIELNLFSKAHTPYPIINEFTNDKANSRLENDVHIELHVYSNDMWITGDHNINWTLKSNPNVNDSVRKQIINLNQPIEINLNQQFDLLKINSGNFKIIVNFFKNLIGNYNFQHLRIDEISPDRTEVKLRAIDSKNVDYLQDITSYIQTVSPAGNLDLTDRYRTYLLNFSRNLNVHFVNSVVIGEYLYVKLKDKLPETIDVNFKCWVVEELKCPYIDNVSILPKIVTSKFNKLSSANWDANYSYNTSTDTGLKSWNELLGASTSTSQQLVDAYFSGSFTKLNINYSDFNNFIFYSSATARVENFVYKFKLLDYYTSQSLNAASISGSVSLNSSNNFLQLRSNLIGSFDAFEKYLYYESSSKITTYDVPNVSYNVIEITGSYVTPVPKLNQTIPYTPVSISSNTFKSWYEDLREKSAFYDQFNRNALINAIPEYILLNSDNSSLSTFINMLGQHYDILYSYINHMSRINTREENHKFGMPNELLYSVAKQFGWSLNNGNQSNDLWQYVLGTSETGIPMTGSNSVGDPSVPGSETTYAIWRRIINNLPVLLKSKGTKRSIQALLSCYGIPKSLISINEYGGPRVERIPVYEKLTSNYALNLSDTTTGTVTTNYSQSINAIQLRFRTVDVVKYPTMPSKMTLFTIGSDVVTLNYVSGTKGTVNIENASSNISSSKIVLFDGNWSNVVLNQVGNQLKLVVGRAKHGKIIYTVSASISSSFPNMGSIVLGDTSAGSNRLRGYLQEFRIWNTPLENSYFVNHIKAPGAYNSLDTYDDLIFRLPLTDKTNHNTYITSSGVQPKISNISSSFNNWSLAFPYESIEEIYYYDAISIGSSTYDDNKIRLESTTLSADLNVNTRVEVSQYDTAPLDNNKLGVYFSPQTMIDEDIIAHLGSYSFDQYIGDTTGDNKTSYPDLVVSSNEYWKKYENKTNINSYISIFSLYDLSFFQQLEQLIPARANKLTGILIQPTLLERSKATVLPNIQRFDNAYSVTLNEPILTTSAENIYTSASVLMTKLPIFDQLELEAPTITFKLRSSASLIDINGLIDKSDVTMTGTTDILFGFLTASQAKKYVGTTYKYVNLIRRKLDTPGPLYITASNSNLHSDPLQPAILNGHIHYQGLSKTHTYFRSGSKNIRLYESASIQDTPTGILNHRYNGCKLTSKAFNVKSTQTIDGGAVVEIRKTNPNQLIYQKISRKKHFTQK